MRWLSPNQRGNAFNSAQAAYRLACGDISRRVGALEFFFHKSAPLLAGLFESVFWNGSVLQLSLARPAIRQAIATIGSVHEGQGLKRLQNGSSSSGDSSTGPETAMQPYNRAIRLVIARENVDPNTIPAVTMASILFTCLEFPRG
jgi:hypothetical protein